MKYVLWIDDDPTRWNILDGIQCFANVFFAHGFDQVNHYLNYSGIKWDLIILDHDMPLMNGMDVARDFLIERNIPVVLCSANMSARQEQFNLLNSFNVPVDQVPIHDRDFHLKIVRKLT